MRLTLLNDIRETWRLAAPRARSITRFALGASTALAALGACCVALLYLAPPQSTATFVALTTGVGAGVAAVFVLPLLVLVWLGLDVRRHYAELVDMDSDNLLAELNRDVGPPRDFDGWVKRGRRGGRLLDGIFLVTLCASGIALLVSFVAFFLGLVGQDYELLPVLTPLFVVAVSGMIAMGFMLVVMFRGQKALLARLESEADAAARGA